MSNGFTDWAQDVVIIQNSIYVGGLIGEPLGKIMVMKMTIDGDTLWTRTFDQVNASLKCLIAYGDGSIGGLATEEDGRYIHAFKFTSAGNLLWSKLWSDSTGVNSNCKIGGAFADSLGRVSILANIFSQDPDRGLFLSYDADGVVIGSRLFDFADSSGYFEITSACLTVAGSPALSCYAWDGFHIIKLSEAGDVISNRVYGSPATYPKKILAKQNGELAVVSYHTDSLTQMDINLHIIGVDGTLRHARQFSDLINVTESPRDASIGSVGEILVVGSNCASSCSPLVLSYVEYTCGDSDSNNMVNISDAVNIINYIFTGGQAPFPVISADVDSNSLVTISDAVYLINYIFAGGAAPCEG